jgi:hypothetical protein
VLLLLLLLLLLRLRLLAAVGAEGQLLQPGTPTACAPYHLQAATRHVTAVPCELPQQQLHNLAHASSHPATIERPGKSGRTQHHHTISCMLMLIRTSVQTGQAAAHQ